MGNLLLGKLFNWIKKQTDVLNFFKGLRNILKSSNLKIDKREKKNINFKNFFVSFLGILFSLFFSGYNTVFAGPPLNPVAFLVEQEIYIIPIFREIEIFSIEMIRLKKTKKGALGIRVMPLGDIF